MTAPLPGISPRPEGDTGDRAARLGEEAGRIGHDLNNCLGVIMGRAELARMHLERGNPDGTRKGLEAILSQSERIKRLVDELRGLRHRT